MQKLFETAAHQWAGELDLAPREIEDLTATITQVADHGHYTYDELREMNRRLSPLPHAAIEPIGVSADGRLIETCIVGGRRVGGRFAYFEGPQHGTERLGSTTTAALKQFFALHPGVIRRWGFDALIFSDYIDPAGMAMQDLPPYDPPLEVFVRGAWRGSWADQMSWGYPTCDFAGSPEALASLWVLQTYEPEYIAALHSATFVSHVLVARPIKEAAVMTGILDAFGMPINRSEPEAPQTPVYAPGVFGIARQETVREVMDSGGATVVPEDIGGTTIAEHALKGAQIITPEVAWVMGDCGPDDPLTADTYATAVRYRTHHAHAAIACIDDVLKRLDHYKDSWAGNLTTRRLYDAAAWWSGSVPKMMDGELLDAERRTRLGLLTHSERSMVVGTIICNSLVYLGNARRLAVLARDADAVAVADRGIAQGLRALGSTRRIDLQKQIAAQAIIALAGMRRAA